MQTSYDIHRVRKTGASFARGKSKQDYETPPEFIAAVVKRFGPLAWDLAATEANAKAPAWYGIEQDSLKMPWWELEGNKWLNPPFDDITPWAQRCSLALHNRRKWRMSPEPLIMLLTPASIGSNWFRDWVFGRALVLALNGRLSFDGKNPYPKTAS